MKIAISGSAGTGKTSLATTLSDRWGCPIIPEHYDEFFDKNFDFIRPADRLQRQIFDVLEIKNRLENESDEFIADRCPIDLFNLWLSRGYASNQRKTHDLYDRCRSYVIKYDCIVVLPWGSLPLGQVDSCAARRRVMNPWTQLHNHSTMIGLLQQWVPAKRLLPISHSLTDISSRARAVTKMLKKLMQHGEY